MNLFDDDDILDDDGNFLIGGNDTPQGSRARTGDYHAGFDGSAARALAFDDHDDMMNLDNGGAGISLLGADDHETLLLSLIRQGRMPHALILHGPRGVGKATFAFKLARTLLDHPAVRVHNTVDMPVDTGPSLFGDDMPAVLPSIPDTPFPDSLSLCENGPAAAKIAAGAHPDFLMIGGVPESDEGRKSDIIPVDEVRKVPQFLRLKPSIDGGWRVVIVDNADFMNRNAQNALLKILEEPPPQTVLILIAHSIGRLLPTIRSRSRAMAFKPLSPDLFALALSNMGYTPKPDELKWLSALTDGCPGQVGEWISQNVMATTGTFFDLWNRWPDLNDSAWQAFITPLSLKSDDAAKALSLNIQLWMWWIKSSVRAKTDPQHRLFLADLVQNPDVSRIIDDFSLGKWISLYDKLQDHFAKTRTAALDVGQALMSARFIMTSDTL